jgi:hypothetical protein
MAHPFRVIMLLLTATTLFHSCKKDDPDPIQLPSPALPGNPIPAVDSASGVLVAIQTANYINIPLIGEVNQAIGIGLAFFGDIPNAVLTDAGTVQVNETALTRQSAGTYVFTPAVTSPNGIDFNDSVIWDVSGDSVMQVPALNYNVARPMPSGAKYSGSATIPLNASFTLSSSKTITDADSVIYQIIGNAATLRKIVAGSVPSVSFTAAEMTSLSAGGGYIQIVPFNISSTFIAGKKFYFVNESVATHTVTFN